MIQPSPDPLLQAALDARVQPVPLKLVPPTDSKATVQVALIHPDSKFDFSDLNVLSHQLATMLPGTEPVPPQINPQTVMQNPRSLAVVKAKDEGNVGHAAYKGKHFYSSCITAEIIWRGKICTGNPDVYHSS